MPCRIAVRDQLRRLAFQRARFRRDLFGLMLANSACKAPRLDLGTGKIA